MAILAAERAGRALGTDDSMNEDIEHVTEADDATDYSAGVIAADDTGLLAGEIQIVEAELREGEVTPVE